MTKNKALGHIAALFTIMIWGTSYIVSTELLKYLTPAEIILCRFLFAGILLNIIYPPRLKFENVKRECTYALAGLCGVTLYFFLEIASLRYTKAANVSVLVSTAPFFCSLMAFFSKKSDKPKFNFFVGFLLAIAGIMLVTFENGFTFDMNMKGMLFAIGSAAAWGLYSILTKEIGSFGHNTIATTRRIFMYGLIFMIPALFAFDMEPTHIKLLANKQVLIYLAYLGIISSGICFLTWNTAINALGPVKTTAYIYISPLVTIVCSYFILKTQSLTWQLLLGAALIIAGLLTSVTKSTNAPKAKKKRKNK